MNVQYLGQIVHEVVTAAARFLQALTKLFFSLTFS